MQTNAFPKRAQSDLINSSKLLLAPFNPNLRPKGALLRLLIGTPPSGGHPDPAAGQTPLFGLAAEACDGRCVCFRLWLIHVDRRHCSYTAEARTTRTRGTSHSSLDPSLNFVYETRGIINYTASWITRARGENRRRDGGGIQEPWGKGWISPWA